MDIGVILHATEQKVGLMDQTQHKPNRPKKTLQVMKCGAALARSSATE